MVHFLCRRTRRYSRSRQPYSSRAGRSSTNLSLHRGLFGSVDPRYYSEDDILEGPSDLLVPTATVSQCPAGQRPGGTVNFLRAATTEGRPSPEGLVPGPLLHY